MGISTSSFGSQASILNINSVEPTHRGEYTCVASNAAGKSKYTAVLEVNGTSVVVDRSMALFYFIVYLIHSIDVLLFLYVFYF